MSDDKNTSKKRKIDDSKNANVERSLNGGSDKIHTKSVSSSSNSSPFKVPEVPKLSKGKKLYDTNAVRLDPNIIANAEAINQMSKSQCSNQSSPIKTKVSPAKQSPFFGGKTMHQSPSNGSGPHSNGISYSTKTATNASNHVHSPEMAALCNAVIERNTRKLTECVRSSLELTLEDFLNTTKPHQQMQRMQDQLNELQSDYNTQIDNLKSENKKLTQDLDSLHSKHMTLTKDLAAMKSENAILTADLNAEVEKNLQLVANLGSTLKEKAEWKSMVSKLWSWKPRPSN